MKRVFVCSLISAMLTMAGVRASEAFATESVQAAKKITMADRKKSKLNRIKPVAVFDYSKFGHTVKFKRLKHEYVFTTPEGATFFSASAPSSAPTRQFELRMPQLGEVTVADIVGEVGQNKFITDLEAFEGDIPTGVKELRVYDAVNKTSVNLGEKLISCVTVGGTEYCDPVPIGQITVEGSRIFIAAGASPNLFFTDDFGKNWSTVSGSFPVQDTMCYGASFLRTKTHLIQGGECPLDMAFVRVYKFKDATGTSIEPKPVASVEHGFMGNRAAWNISSNPETNQIFAGVEGGLIELTGENFSPVFRIEHAISGGNDVYPYYEGLTHAEGQPKKMHAWGNGQVRGGTLMATMDGGKTWTDITARVIGGNIATQDINDVYYDAKKDRFLITVSPDSYSAPDAPVIFSTYEFKM